MLDIRGEEKVNEKKRESESNKGNERRDGESTERKNLFGGYSQLSLGSRQPPTGTKQVIKLQSGYVPHSHNSRGWGKLLQWEQKVQ